MTDPERHLSFERAVNFRDMGGYRGADGKRTRWRCLFRSGHMARFTPSDINTFERLGIGKACDFRSDHERSRAPSPCLPSNGVRILSISPRQDHDELLAAWLSGEAADEAVIGIQDAIYREIVVEHSDRYREMFAALLANDGKPFLIHCSGGKDRTGIGAALLLSALGVAEDTIYADYIETLQNRTTTLWMKKLAAQYLQNGRLEAAPVILERVSRLFGVTPERLATAFSAMKDLSGSVSRYLEQHIALSRDDIAKLQNWYLEA